MNAINLTPKQEKFAQEYISTGNASEAYRLAYSASKMKPETVNKRASELLANGVITGRIGKLRAAIAELAIVKESQVINEAARLALSDPAKLFNVDGTLKSIHDMDPDIRAAIASIEVEEITVDGVSIGRVKKVKLWDKNSALEKLMKHLGSFEKDNKQRAGMFVNVPRGTMKMIEEKLAALAALS